MDIRRDNAYPLLFVNLSFPNIRPCGQPRTYNTGALERIGYSATRFATLLPSHSVVIGWGIGVAMLFRAFGLVWLYGMIRYGGLLGDDMCVKFITILGLR